MDSTLINILQQSGLDWLHVSRAGMVIDSRFLSRHATFVTDKIVSSIVDAETSEIPPSNVEVDTQRFEVLYHYIEDSDSYLCTVSADRDVNLRRIERAKVLEEIAGEMIHTFNNILMEFQGHMSLFERTAGIEDTGDERLDKMADAVLRARLMTERFIFYMRRVEDPDPSVGLSQVFDDVSMILEPYLEPRISIQFDYETAEALQLGVQHQIAVQMLVCLLVDLVRTGHVSRELLLTAGTEDDDYVRVAVPVENDGYLCHGNETVQYLVDEMKCLDGELLTRIIDGVEQFVFLFPRVQTEVVRSSVPKRSRPIRETIILLIDENSQRSEQNKEMLESMFVSVLDISAENVALEVFRSQPGTFEFVIVDTEKELLAEDMRLMSPDSTILVVGPGKDLSEWPQSAESWQELLVVDSAED